VPTSPKGTSEASKNERVSSMSPPPARVRPAQKGKNEGSKEVRDSSMSPPHGMMRQETLLPKGQKGTNEGSKEGRMSNMAPPPAIMRQVTLLPKGQKGTIKGSKEERMSNMAPPHEMNTKVTSLPTSQNVEETPPPSLTSIDMSDTAASTSQSSKKNIQSIMSSVSGNQKNKRRSNSVSFDEVVGMREPFDYVSGSSESDNELAKNKLITTDDDNDDIEDDGVNDNIADIEYGDAVNEDVGDIEVVASMVNEDGFDIANATGLVECSPPTPARSVPQRQRVTAIDSLGENQEQEVVVLDQPEDGVVDDQHEVAVTQDTVPKMSKLAQAYRHVDIVSIIYDY
jgi:hypothetical protein